MDSGISKNNNRIQWIMLGMKYAFPLFLMILAFLTTHGKKYFVVALAELFTIIVLTDLIPMGRVKTVVNGVLVLFLNIQLLIFYFGGSFLSLVMLTNLDNLEDLSGKALIYSVAVVMVIVFSFLPVGNISLLQGKHFRTLTILLAAELLMTLQYGNAYSPFFAYATLVQEEIGVLRLKRDLQDSTDYTTVFFQGGIPQGVEKPDTLVEKPNIVLIFTEGFSENIISDNRDITPNITMYQEEGISFSNYYNHTFATYRGLIGQLYSGYQLDNYDTNSLISLQSILHDEGYHTVFINSEPNNAQFTKYLENMGFDELVSVPGNQYSGPARSLSDKEAYDKLYETMLKEEQDGQPFFCVIYTFGTHASFDSPDEVYGDGSDTELNKLYNLDAQFGSFMTRFTESSLFDDTVLVFTTDHASYADLYYTKAFPDYGRDHPSIDTIPAFIYHKNVSARVIDAEGRNSLDLAPTILDYLDISAPNYFLGTSLFYVKENNNNYDTVYTASSEYISTDGGSIGELSPGVLDIVKEGIREYYIAKQ